MGSFAGNAGVVPGQPLRPGMPVVTSPVGNMGPNMGGFIRPQSGMPLGGISPTAVLPRSTAAPMSLGSSSPTLSMTGSIARGSLEANSRKPPATSLDLLGQEFLQTQKQQQKQKQEVAPLSEKIITNSASDGSLVSLDEPVNPIVLPPPPQQVSTPPTPPTVSLDDAFVPLDSVLPGIVGGYGVDSEFFSFC